jgi:hypothetical protein
MDDMDFRSPRREDDLLVRHPLATFFVALLCCHLLGIQQSESKLDMRYFNET